MSNWKTANRVISSPMGELYWGTSLAERHEEGSFLPICQYPLVVDVLDKEIGAMVSLGKDGAIKKVHKRICISS